jgi:hypothetical protein
MQSLARRYLVILSAFVVALPALAQESKPLTAIPPGDFQFTGTWDCTGAMGNGATHKAVFTGSVILGGKWLELTERDVEPATGYLAKYLIGYDPQQKHLIEFDANNFAAATYTSADGWVKGVLTMTSPVSDDPKAPYAANRFLYSITAPDTFTVDWQISRTSTLQWTPGDRLVCKRVGQPPRPQQG